jgi:hypothetical protein
MKKAITVVVTALLLSLGALSSVYASGDKVHGDAGQGEVDQGETGSDMGNAQGDDGQGNQVG